MVGVDLVREGLVVEAEVEAVHAREQVGGRVLLRVRVRVRVRVRGLGMGLGVMLACIPCRGTRAGPPT